MRRSTNLLLALTLALTWAPAGIHAAGPLADGAVRTAGGRVLRELPSQLQQPSIHAEMLAEHASDAITFVPGDEPSVLLTEGGAPRLAGADAESTGTTQISASGLPNGLRKQVFGFLPYWMLTDSALDDLNYHLVSTIAYFSVGVSKDGYLQKGTTANPTTGWSGWMSANMTQVIDRAHASGVKVVLTVTMMAWDGASAGRQAALLGSGTARARLVNQIVGALRSRGADGVNLDFEPLDTSLRDEYVSFVRQLKKGLVEEGVGSNLTVCVMAGAATWATGYDVARLTASGAADALFVMGYDYNWSGSSRAGGVAPIQSPYTLDVAGTMADFLTETSGSNLIWGVPYYGRTWPTSGSQLNAPTLGGGSKAYVYTGHLSEAARYGRRWDDVGKVPWYRHWDSAAGNWVQGYYDDVQSLGVKYDLINARGLAGTGMWTLLMDQGRDELWRLLANKFVHDTAPPVGGVSLLPATTDAQVLWVGWRAVDYASAVSHYNVQYRRVGGDWRAWLSGTHMRGAWFAGTAGQTYQFRIRAFDTKGNAQSWVTLPSKPANLKAGAFARVASATLNVRSGPGTGYAIVATANKGDQVLVIDGPTSSGGYAWYRVQYGFSEWPSAEYPLIAWMAGSSSTTTYLAPRAAPTTTTLAPFVTATSRTERFSPNGDGVQDGARVAYTLKADASQVRLHVLDEEGDIVRGVALGAQDAGAHSTTWDGRTTAGVWAAGGTYVLRITAVDASGALHYGPARVASQAVVDRWGSRADKVKPVAAGRPAAGAEMVRAKASPWITFSEPISGLSATTVQLRVDGTAIAAAVLADPGGMRATITPSDPLPVDASVRLWLSRDLRDAAGNPLTSGGWSFMTAPGTVYEPARDGRLSMGGHIGYSIDQEGDLLRSVRTMLWRKRDVGVAQRATLPNLPGRWLLVESGPLAGRWLRESAADRVHGTTERRTIPDGVVLRLRPATHLGQRFDADGLVTASRNLTIHQAQTVTADARAVINGRAYWRVASGWLSGYWVAESGLAFRNGFVDRMDFTSAPRLDLAAGTYTGYEYDASGRITGSVTVKPVRPRTLTVVAWAVINGRARYLVSGGGLDGTWLIESTATSLHV
jgi:spore germination protein YaaH/uncharacterized protein YraI